jgi:hypothetical protein
LGNGLDGLTTEMVKPLESIQIEQLMELKEDLQRNIDKVDEKNILNIIKIIGNKKISMELLTKSGIGKTLSQIMVKTAEDFTDKTILE